MIEGVGWLCVAAFIYLLFWGSEKGHGYVGFLIVAIGCVALGPLFG